MKRSAKRSHSFSLPGLPNLLGKKVGLFREVERQTPLVFDLTKIGLEGWKGLIFQAFKLVSYQDSDMSVTMIMTVILLWTFHMKMTLMILVQNSNTVVEMKRFNEVLDEVTMFYDVNKFKEHILKNSLKRNFYYLFNIYIYRLCWYIGIGLTNDDLTLYI